MIGVRATASMRPSRRPGGGSRVSTTRQRRLVAMASAASKAAFGGTGTISGSMSG